MEMRLGINLEVVERDDGNSAYFHNSVYNMNHIIMNVLMCILSIISNRYIYVHNLNIKISNHIGFDKCARTLYSNNFHDATIFFNQNVIEGPFHLISTLLHELSHVISAPYLIGTRHSVPNFYKYNIWLFGVVYYRLVNICKNLNFTFDFNKLNNISISESVY